MVGAAQMKAALAILGGAAILALGCQDEIPPYGEALVIVDTDLPVPRIVSRLRVDLYTADRGTWYLSREIPTLDPGAWPVSFSVYDPEDTEPRDVVLRLRAYPGGVVRDYHGERYTPRPAGGGAADPAPIAPVPPGETPRLVADDGADITPSSEPVPWAAVDRLIRLSLEPGVRGSLRVLLGGACAGTMADLAGGVTCIDAEQPASPIPDAELDPDMTRPDSTLAGSFGAEVPCTASIRPASALPDGTPLFDEEACVPGGIFVLGSVEAYGRGELSDLPPRIAILPPFRMDRYEVTVGRWRDALAHGFAPEGMPFSNSTGLGSSPGSTFACTWSDQPLGRETFPLNCVYPRDARAFCQFMGGDMTTEAAWEYVAMDAGRDVKTRYPWGNEAPSCERAVFARQTNAGPGAFSLTNCNPLGAGVQPSDAASGAAGDVALGTGVVNLAGSLSEIMRDSFASFDSACWASQPLTAPSCTDPASTDVAARAGSWALNAASLAGDYRGKLPANVRAAMLGFRCVRDLP